MSRPRTRRPETVRLEVSDGDWLLVKKHLTAGEQRHMFARMMREQKEQSDYQVNPLKVGLSEIEAYLLDWSFTDADGKPIVIRDVPNEEVISALDSLDTDSFKEVLQAVQTHRDAMQEERERERATPFGETASSAT